jgi:predicted RNA-binding protein YlqC (UPF0109 family)
LKDLLETLARALVSNPGGVSVESHGGGREICLDLLVAPEDRGRVIGREGRTADSLRALLDVVARQRGVRCDVEIVD